MSKGKKFDKAAYDRKMWTIVKKLKEGVTVKDLMDSGRFEFNLIDRAYEEFQRRSIHGSKKTYVKCKCGALVIDLDIFGDCLACQLRKGKR